MTNIGLLEVTTPSDREIAMTRVFNAPARLVFDAWTKPELIKRWLGLRAGWTMAVCEVDLKVGG
ncbi:MAG: SRPBCC domain-containing protein, partial [Chloroflexota bacterium]|nr:SRPBCC domain-containing protein [Chloroflexota bacterium]